jgi:hypothetical protein
MNGAGALLQHLMRQLRRLILRLHDGAPDDGEHDQKETTAHGVSAAVGLMLIVPHATGALLARGCQAFRSIACFAP